MFTTQRISIRFRLFLCRWKAENESFPTAQQSSKTDQYPFNYDMSIFVSLESWEWELSNGATIIENGSISVQLWYDYFCVVGKLKMRAFQRRNNHRKRINIRSIMIYRRNNHRKRINIFNYDIKFQQMCLRANFSGTIAHGGKKARVSLYSTHIDDMCLGPPNLKLI